MKVEVVMGGEEVARVEGTGCVTMLMLLFSSASVPLAQGAGAVRRDAGTNWFGLPPCWLRHVAVST
jgi:hypothetical protein